MRCHLAVALVLALTTAVPAYADDALVVNGQQLAPAKTETAPLKRPRLLTTLYASYAGLQAYDVYSTRQALSRGGREANPLMQGVADSSAGMIAVKAGVTLATILVAERMWKRNNKMGAIAVLVASNGVAAVVAARNASTLRQLR